MHDHTPQLNPYAKRIKSKNTYASINRFDNDVMMTHQALHDDRYETSKHPWFPVQDLGAVSDASSQDPPQDIAARGREGGRQGGEGR